MSSAEGMMRLTSPSSSPPPLSLSLASLFPSSPSSGEDAVKFETLPDDVIVAKALSVLRSIFGDQIVPEVSLLI